MAATPYKRAMARKLKARLQDEPTDGEASGSEEEYPIGSDAQTGHQTTQNRSKKIETVPQPIRISTPSYTIEAATSFQYDEGEQSLGDESSSGESRSQSSSGSSSEGIYSDPAPIKGKNRWWTYIDRTYKKMIKKSTPGPSRKRPIFI